MHNEINSSTDVNLLSARRMNLRTKASRDPSVNGVPEGLSPGETLQVLYANHCILVISADKIDVSEMKLCTHVVTKM